MNKENFCQLIGILEDENSGFNMEKHFSHYCGSPRCISGYASILAFKEKNVVDDPSKCDTYINDCVAAGWLDIPLSKAMRLFYCYKNSVWVDYAEKYNVETNYGGGINRWDSIPKEMAIEVLTDIVSGKIEL